MIEDRQRHLDDIANWEQYELIDVMDSAFKFFETFDLRARGAAEEPVRIAFSALVPSLAYVNDSPLGELVAAALTVAYDSAYAVIARALGVDEHALAGVMEDWDGMHGVCSDSVSFAEFERRIREQERIWSEWLESQGAA